MFGSANLSVVFSCSILRLNKAAGLAFWYLNRYRISLSMLVLRGNQCSSVRWHSFRKVPMGRLLKLQGSLGPGNPRPCSRDRSSVDCWHTVLLPHISICLAISQQTACRLYPSQCLKYGFCMIVVFAVLYLYEIYKSVLCLQLYEFLTGTLPFWSSMEELADVCSQFADLETCVIAREVGL